MWTSKTVQDIPTRPKVMGIYQITNIYNGKKYIGKSKDIRKRWMEHIRYSRKGEAVNAHFQAAWNKHGEDSFTFQIIEVIEDVSLLSTREKCLVELNSPEYNVAIVEDGQWILELDEATRQKMSESTRNHRINAAPEWNKKIGDALRGKKKSKEHTRKMRESLTGRKLTPEQIEKIRKSSTGKPVPDYAKKKIAEKAMGNQRWKLRTPQWRENMIAGVKKRWERYRQMKNDNAFVRKLRTYLASGWFSPDQERQLTRLEQVFDSRSDWIDLFSPRRIFICPPDAPQDVQENVFAGNVKHIKGADFCLVNTTWRDIGTIWESGAAYAYGTKIVYFCEGLPKGAKFNLMLAKSGIKVCTSFEQLEDYLERCKAAGEMLVEPYDKEIE